MKYTLSRKVNRIMEALAIPQAEMESMIQRAAPYTGQGMNRRFREWLFRVDDGLVEDMFLDAIATVGVASAAGWIEEAHPDCHGLGCKGCNWRGNYRRYL